jgi:signal transduction histidine kinase
MGAALLANFGVGVAAARAFVADRRREAESATAKLQESRDSLTVLAELQAALRRVATLVARGVTSSEVFSVVADEMRRCLHVRTAGLLRYEEGGGVIVASSYDQPQTQRFPSGEFVSLAGDSAAAMVLRTGRPARMDSFEDAAGSIAVMSREVGFHATVAAPIVVDGRLWGVAYVASLAPQQLPLDTEARLGDFAELVATAISNAATHDDLIASRARIVAAADDARRRLERDLHDGAQQRLIALGLELRSTQASVPPELQSVQEQLSGVVSGLTAVSAELREISHGIHPAILSNGGLGPALKMLARRSAVPVALNLGINRRLPSSVEVGAYYVVAEALTNAAKHAQASKVAVCAESDNANLTLSVRDDGIGGADATKGSGLIGLNDRVEALGGHMRVTSPPASGTSLYATIPLDLE